MMLILDTDHLTILDRGGSAALPLQMRLAQVAPDKIGTTIVNYEEQMRGWLSHAAQAAIPQRMIEAYALLRVHVETFRDLPLLPFDSEAAAEYERVRLTKLRIGTMDLKIAAICLANDATVLTRNLKDFNKVPSLQQGSKSSRGGLVGLTRPLCAER